MTSLQPNICLTTTRVKQVINKVLYSTDHVKHSRHTRRGTKAGRNFFRPIHTLVNSKRHSYFPYTEHQREANLSNLSEVKREISYVSDHSDVVLTQIPTLITNRPPKTLNTRTIEYQNFVRIPKATKRNKHLTLCTLNCRSVKNKTTSINDFIVSNHVDLLAITETWLGSEIDKVVVAEMIPSGYDIHHISRIGQKGGGVALIYNRSAEVKVVKQQNTYTNFELIECDVKTENVGFRIFVVYRPPPSKKNNFQVSAFLDEFSLLLQSSTAMSEEVIITGDINFHLDDPSDQNARKF